MSYPYKWYDFHYYNKWADTGAEHFHFLRIQDRFAALCYMHGLMPYRTVEEILDVVNISLQFGNVKLEEGEKNIPLQDTLYIKDSNFITQIDMLKKHQFGRSPQNVLEIGAGSGLLNIAVNYMGYNSFAVEPCDSFDFFLNRHLKELDLINKIDVQHYKFFQDMPESILSKIDTVIFCATVEHIPKKYFYPILDKIKKHVNNCYCIITNTIDYWPIPIYWKAKDDHVFYQDDNVYEKIKTYFSNTLYQEGSHLVGIIN